MMKHKSIRKSVSLLVCLSLLTTLLLMCSGCGSKDKEALVGTWECEVDLTSMMNDEMNAGLGNDPDLMGYFTIKDFTVKLSLTFRDDDTYTLSADEDSMSKSVDSVLETFRAGFTSYVEDMIAEQDPNMTVDEFFALANTTFDDFFDQTIGAALDKDELVSVVDEMESNGTFEAKDSILYLTDDDGTGMESYKLDGDKLTLTGEGVDDGSLEGLYPLVFNKK